jgi:hypothetical protein
MLDTRPARRDGGLVFSSCPGDATLLHGDVHVPGLATNERLIGFHVAG